MPKGLIHGMKRNGTEEPVKSEQNMLEDHDVIGMNRS